MNRRRLVTGFALVSTLALAGCAGLAYEESGQQVRLYGSSEVPPVTTQAYGTGVVNIATERSVTVTLSVVGMAPTMAHIHEGPAGANGPVIVPLVKVGDAGFASADGAKMTESQYAAYKAGNTYLNVHSAKFPGGEVRSQLAGK